jgi:hypothetical protein
MRRSEFRVIPPREPAKKRGRPKLDLRPLEHVRFGEGKLLAIRQVDGSANAYVVDVKFSDGTTRTLLLAQGYWVNDIKPFLPEPPKRCRAAKAKPVLEVDASITGEDGEQELEMAA